MDGPQITFFSQDNLDQNQVRGEIAALEDRYLRGREEVENLTLWCGQQTEAWATSEGGASR